MFKYILILLLLIPISAYPRVKIQDSFCTESYKAGIIEGIRRQHCFSMCNLTRINKVGVINYTPRYALVDEMRKEKCVCGK